MFKLDCGLQFRVSINPATMHSLRLKVASLQLTGIVCQVLADVHLSIQLPHHSSPLNILEMIRDAHMVTADH